jgi:hypothetical protein
MKLYSSITSLLLVFACSGAGFAQDLDLEHIDEGFTKEQLLKLNGSASLSGIYYNGNNNQNERLPFTYFANGFLNARIANLIDVPLSFVLTNVGGSFQYPTLPSRLAIHPSYKWARAHIGNVAMTFSPYTLNGHLFDGAGVELQPGKFTVSAMMGRLQRAQEYDISNLASPAAYRRMGQAIKIGYTTEKYRIAYNIFRAKDDAQSIAMLPPDSLNIRPQSNIATSLEAGIKIAKGLDLQAEYANTGLTTLTTAEGSADKASAGGFNPAALFIKTQTATEFHSAIRAGLNYAFRKSIIGLGYERVDPGYRTLGAYFFNNDLENFTINFAQRLLKEKMTINTSLGLQRDNLGKDKAATSNRTVGMFNLAYFPSQRVNIVASYSNFLSYTNVHNRFQNINQVNPYQYIDTLNFMQVSQNAMLNTNITLVKTDQINHNVNFTGTFLDSKDKNGDEVNKQSSSRFYNGAVTWNTQFAPQKISAALGYNFNQNVTNIGNFTTQGPIASVSWILLNDKLMTNLALSYNNTTGGTLEKTTVLNSRINARYMLAKLQTVNFSILGQNRTARSSNTSDWILNLAYELSF